MAQSKYRGNLSAKAFPFLSTQFGRTVLSNGLDHVTAFGDAGGDNNIPQAYYMHNVMPTVYGYKSVGFNSIIPQVGVTFSQVMPTRDPSMVRGLVGVTTDGRVFMYHAGNTSWVEVTSQLSGVWIGGNASIAYAGGYTYLCLAGNGVYKLNVAGNTLAASAFSGIVMTGIVAITSRANYLILTDGISIYWSSTISPEDFVPSQVTGAGSGKVSDAEGLIVALAPLGNGFAVYTSVNVVVAAYSQNPRYPWVFTRVDNSKGIANISHVTYNGDDGTNFAWTSGGLQKVSSTGAASVMAEVTDFLAGQEFEDYDTVNNVLNSQYLTSPYKVKVAFVAARFLVISYGIESLTHALVYDTALKRWGKLRINHAACFELALNTDSAFVTSNASASAKKTLGFVTNKGEVVLCDFTNNAKATDSILILGKFQVIRSRNTTLDCVSIESIDSNAVCKVMVASTLDGKTLLTPLSLNPSTISADFREYPARVTGVNHSVILSGQFNLNSYEIAMHFSGRR